MPSSALLDPRSPLPTPRLSSKHSTSLLALSPSLPLLHCENLQLPATPVSSTPDGRSAGRFGMPVRNCTRPGEWGTPYRFSRGVPSSLRMFSISDNPNSENKMLQVRFNGTVRENGRPLRRNYRVGGVRLVHASGRSGSARRASDPFVNK